MTNAKPRERTLTPPPGLPEHLPEGERLLWQGKPDWLQLALSAFHVRKVALYFALLIAWRLWRQSTDGVPVQDAVANNLPLLVSAVLALPLLLLLAWLSHRTTIYTITDRRVVMKFGIALPFTINLPFKAIGAAAAALRQNGTGDIPLKLIGTERLGYVAMWPHVRPWRINNPEPMLRAIPDARHVAELLTRAVEETTSVSVAPALRTSVNPVSEHVEPRPMSAAIA